MSQKALIVEPSRLFQLIIKKILDTIGVEYFIYSTAKDALEATHDEYTFILISRTLENISGEIFLNLYGVKHGLGSALTILLTASEDSAIAIEAKEAGYKLVISKKKIESLKDNLVRDINKRTLNLDVSILFVEDSQSIANLVVALFKKNRSEIYHIKRISEMKSTILEGDFDLIITDYNLSDDETGDDVISYVRNLDEADKANTPILVVSGETNQEKRTSILRNGANDFILKPFDNDELLVRSSNLISSNKILKESKKLQQELLKLANTDHLTGLYNRHSLNDIAPRYISNAIRHNMSLSLLVIDLDHFKNINDTRGHSAGDIVLQSISAVLQNSCRTEDIVARFGGEEFVMLLPHCDIDNAAQKAESLRKLIEDTEPEGLIVTSSIGVSELTDGDGFSMLFDKADKAVYEAKEQGRNRVVVCQNI